MSTPSRYKLTQSSAKISMIMQKGVDNIIDIMSLTIIINGNTTICEV